MATQEQIEKLEKQSKQIQLRSMIANWEKMPGLSDDVKKNIKEVLPDLLPGIKEWLKNQLYNSSKHLGTGDGKKAYVIQNGKNGPTLYRFKDMVVSGGEKEFAIPLERIVNKVDEYEKIEDFIIDLFTLKIIEEEMEEIKKQKS